MNGVPWNWMKQAIPIKTVVRLYNPVCIYIYTYTHNNTSTPPGTLGIAHQKFPFSKSLIIDGFDLKEMFNSNRSSECFELSYCRFTFQKPMCISRGHSFSKSHFRAFHSIPLKQLTQHQLTQALHVFRPLAVAKIPWQWCCSSSQRRCSPRYSCDVLSLNIYSWRIWASHVIILCKMWATFGCVSSSFNETITNLKEAKLDTASKIYFGPSSQVLLFDVPLGAGKLVPSQSFVTEVPWLLLIFAAFAWPYLMFIADFKIFFLTLFQE